MIRFNSRTVTSFLGVGDFAEEREVEKQSDEQKHHLPPEPLALEIADCAAGKNKSATDQHQYKAGHPQNRDVASQLCKLLPSANQVREAGCSERSWRPATASNRTSA